MSKLIVGCGYLGLRLARRWRRQGEQVFVTTRSAHREKILASEGLQPIRWDVTHEAIPRLPVVESVVFAIGFDRQAGYPIQDVYVDGLGRVLASCQQSVRRILYISSTGVYGQSDGRWVDETAPAQPDREGGRACLAAEQLLQHHPMFGQKAIILRLAGIYGPGRLPQLEPLRQGRPLAVAADAFLNLIHVDDAVRVIAVCERQTQPPQVFCVSDGQPVRREDFYRHLAALIGSQDPSFESPSENSSQAKRARANKRISNQRLVRETSIVFAYPSFREGLTAIMQLDVPPN